MRTYPDTHCMHAASWVGSTGDRAPAWDEPRGTIASRLYIPSVQGVFQCLACRCAATDGAATAATRALLLNTRPSPQKLPVPGFTTGVATVGGGGGRRRWTRRAQHCRNLPFTECGETCVRAPVPHTCTRRAQPLCAALQRREALLAAQTRYAAGLHTQAWDIDELCTAPCMTNLRIDDQVGSTHLGAPPPRPLPSTRSQPHAAPEVLLLTRKAAMRRSRGGLLFQMHPATTVSLHLSSPPPPSEQRG